MPPLPKAPGRSPEDVPSPALSRPSPALHRWGRLGGRTAGDTMFGAPAGGSGLGFSPAAPSPFPSFAPASALSTPAAFPAASAPAAAGFGGGFGSAAGTPSLFGAATASQPQSQPQVSRDDDNACCEFDPRRSRDAAGVKLREPARDQTLTHRRSPFPCGREVRFQ